MFYSDHGGNGSGSGAKAFGEREGEKMVCVRKSGDIMVPVGTFLQFETIQNTQTRQRYC